MTSATTSTEHTYRPTLEALGEAVGKSASALVKYAKRGCPLEKIRGQGYAVEPVEDWIKLHVRDKATAGMGVGRDAATLRIKLLEAQIREKDAAGELKEIKVAIERGELVPLERVKERDISRVRAFRDGLLALPRRLTQELEGLDARQRESLLKERLREILERFAEM